MNRFIHATPATRVVFGTGSRREVAAEVELLGAARALLIGGGHESGVLAEISAALGARLAGTFGEVVMHVPVEAVQRGVEAARTAGVDLLIPVGGGSAVGMAKAIARELGTAILAVATTYAGSEMTPIWGLTENARKVTGRDLGVLPRTVIYDPELTLTLPAGLSANSGMNALAHLVEGLGANTPLRALGLPEAALDEVVAQVVDADPVNPRRVDAEGVRELLAQAYAGGAPAPIR